MSDDFEFDDSFAVDDSFLQEVDTLTARAIARTSDGSAPGLTAKVSAPNGHRGAGSSSGGGWSGPQRSGSGTSGPGPSHPSVPLGPSAPSSWWPKIRLDKPQPLNPRSSGSLVSLSDDEGASSSSKPRTAVLAGTSTSRNGSFQTSIRFKRSNQTKGKRWDRTQFAETGRRIAAKGAAKGRKRVRRGSSDEEEEGEGEEGEDLVPRPKALVDMSESLLASRIESPQADLLVAFRFLRDGRRTHWLMHSRTLRPTTTQALVQHSQNVHLPHQPTSTRLPIRDRPGVSDG